MFISRFLFLSVVISISFISISSVYIFSSASPQHETIHQEEQLEKEPPDSSSDQDKDTVAEDSSSNNGTPQNESLLVSPIGYGNMSNATGNITANESMPEPPLFIRSPENCFCNNTCPRDFNAIRFYIFDPMNDTDPVLGSLHPGAMKLFRKLELHPMRTHNSSEACLFWSALDFRPERNRDTVDLLSSHPQWDSGRNKILYEEYDNAGLTSGSVPDCAIRVKASADKNMLAPGLDVSGDLNFFENHLNLKVLASSPGYAKGKCLPSRPIPKVLDHGSRRKYLLTFKGSRYPDHPLFKTHNIREHLARLHHPGEGIIVLVSPISNTTYGNRTVSWDDYGYDDLLINTTFGLAPRGVGLHSGRMLEMLCTGSIPVVASDNYVFPMGSVVREQNSTVPRYSSSLKWEDSVVQVSESELIYNHTQVVQRLQSMPHTVIRRMRMAALQACGILTCENFRGYVTEVLRSIHDNIQREKSRHRSAL